MNKFQTPRRAAKGSQGMIGKTARLGLVLMALVGALGAQAEAGSAESRIDLNRADAEELAELPGIGAAKAAAIIEHRTENGAFQSVEDLEAVRGIGPALVAKLRPLVTLGIRRDASLKKSPSAAAAPGKPVPAP